MAGLGDLVVHLAANTAEFSSDMGKAAHLAAKNMGDIERSVKKAAAAFGAMAAAASTATAVFIKQTIDAADEMGKLAQKVGVSVEALSALKYAGQLSGVSLEQLEIGLKQMGKSVDEGNEALQRLFPSLSKTQIQSKSNEEVLKMVADRFATMKDSAGKTALAMELFGKSGADLIPLLNGGAKGLAEMADEARRAGVIIDTDTARAAENFNDNLTRLTTSAHGLAMTLANPVIPTLSALSDQLVAAVEHSRSLNEALMTGLHWQPVAERIVNITAKLEELRNARDKLQQENGNAKWFGLLVSENAAAIANVDHTIAGLEQELATLQKIRTTINTQEAESDAARARAGQRGNAPARDDAASAAAAAREKERALREMMKAGQEMAEVEMNGYQELAKLRAKSMADDAAELAARKDSAESAAEEIRKSLLSQQDLLTENYLNKQDQLTAARDLEVLTNQQYNELMQGLEVDHWAKLAEINKKGQTEREKFSEMSLQRQAKTIFGELDDITAGVAQHNRALFEANKVSGIAMAIINAYEGISLTMSKYPFPLNIAMAAAHGVAAFAQVKAIQGSQFGSGGSAPSLAGGTPATPVTPVTGGQPPSQSGQTTIVQLSGADLYSDKSVRELLKRIKETTDKGGKLVIA